MNIAIGTIIFAVALFCLLIDRVWEDAQPKGDKP